MAYTNIASPYMTGNWGPANYNFNRHSWNLFNQDHPAHSKAQFKVALQQLQQQGVLDPARGYANEKLRTEILQGTPGMYSDRNKLGQYQGIHGNFGLKSYNAAKAAGWSPQAIFDEIQTGESGMFMPEGSMAQYRRDIVEGNQWQDDELGDINRRIDQLVDPPGVGYSAPSVVGKSGTRGANLKIAGRGSRSGTKRWKRGGDSSWSMPTVNTGGTSGKAGNSSAVNV